MSEIDPQEFGELKAEVASLRRDQTTLMQQVGKLLENSETLKLQMAEAKGGWKMLMVLGAAAGTLGASIANWLHSRGGS